MLFEQSSVTDLQELYENALIQIIQGGFPLEKELICVEQQYELNRHNSHIEFIIKDKDFGYHFENIDDVKVILKHETLYIPESMREITLIWYHHYLNYPRGDILGNTIKKTCNRKGLFSQAKKYVKTCTVYQQHKKKHKYGHVPINFFEDLVPCRTMDIYVRILGIIMLSLQRYLFVIFLSVLSSYPQFSDY